MAPPSVLIAIISGGRPALRDRATAIHIPSLLATGCPVEWIVREDQADAYEPTPGVPVNAYTVDWASRYARAHWRHPRFPYTPGGWHGAFTGREWSMRTAEQRGLDVVIQLDDNVETIGPMNANWTYTQPGVDAGEMILLAAELAMSTTAMTVGFQLSAIIPGRTLKILRPGYPYSVFAARTGPGRVPWCGPFEEDIMQTLDLALHGGPHRTSAVMEAFTYYKDYKVGGGMREKYTAERGLEIARRYPSNVRLLIGSRTVGPRETKRGMRHYLTTKGFTPVMVTDRDRYEAAAAEVTRITQDAVALVAARKRAKTARRGGADIAPDAWRAHADATPTRKRPGT